MISGKWVGEVVLYYPEKSHRHYLGIFLTQPYILLNEMIIKHQSKLRKRVKNINFKFCLTFRRDDV